jgi:hypothetical protein
MTTAYTSLLGLALPVTGELEGTWGDVVNQQLTELLDAAIAGTTTLSIDADVTLTTTSGAANQAREAILIWTASGTATRYITAPAQSKAYIVVNKTGSTQSIVLRGAGPTTGVTIAAGISAVVVWNGSDFSIISSNTNVFTGSITVLGTASSGAEIKLYEDTDNGSNYVGIKAPASIASDVTWTLPNVDGSNGQALVTNGTGTLSWTTIVSGATISNDTSTTSNLYPAFLGATSGTALNIYTSNAKLLYKPSTGDFQASQLVASNGLVVNSDQIAASYTIATGTNALCVGPITVASGQSVTVSSGQRWIVL